MQAFNIAGSSSDQNEQEQAHFQFHLDINMYDSKPIQTLDLQYLE